VDREKKNALQRAYVERNREKINAKRRAKYAANREEELANITRWRDENRERYNVTRRQNWARNAERHKPKSRAYYQKNREVLLAKLREKNERRGRELYERRRELWELDPTLRDRALARMVKWRREHPGMVSVHYARLLLSKQTGLPFVDIPYDLAEAKLAQLEIMRLIRQSGE
jgi:hypothetical protein